VATREDSRTGKLPPWIRGGEGGVVLEIHLQPGARRSAVVGEHGGRLKIALRAPPIDGRANAELIDFLAARLQLPRGAVRIVAGASSRSKRVAVDGGGAAEDIAAGLAPTAE